MIKHIRRFFYVRCLQTANDLQAKKSPYDPLDIVEAICCKLSFNIKQHIYKT